MSAPLVRLENGKIVLAGKYTPTGVRILRQGESVSLTRLANNTR